MAATLTSAAEAARYVDSLGSEALAKAQAHAMGNHVRLVEGAAVQAICDAFAAGDVAGVLGGMSPDIVWNEADDFPHADGNPVARVIGQA